MMKRKFDVLFKIEVYSEKVGGSYHLISAPGGGCYSTFEAESAEQAAAMALNVIVTRNALLQRQRAADAKKAEANPTGK